MNCTHCQTKLVQVFGQTHHHCPGCGRFDFPDTIEESSDRIKLSGRSTPFQCPSCHVELAIGSLDATEVCVCERCRGFVIDSQSLADVIRGRRSAWAGPDDAPIPMNAVELDVRQSCPACLQFMEAHPYYGPGTVVIESCIACHLTWLDHGELARIVRAPGARPHASSAPQASSVLQIAINNQANPYF